MSVSLPRFPWWLLGKGGGVKRKKSDSNWSALTSATNDCSHGLRESTDFVKFPGRRIEKQNGDDFVMVSSSDGEDCLLGSESDGPDWSIGWVEPHGVNFRSDSEIKIERGVDDDGFAVLVRCYTSSCKEFVEVSNNQILNAVRNFPNKFFSDEKNFMDRLSSPDNF